VKTRNQIAYIFDWKFGPDTGVAKKVLDQVNAWNSFGLQTKLIVCTDKQYATSWLAQDLPVKVYTYSNLLTRRKARNEALKYAKQNGDVKAFYMRYGIFTIPMLFFMLKNRVIIELNFKGFEEYKRRSVLLYSYMRLTRKFIFMKSAGACAVTQEIFDEFKLETRGRVNAGVFPNSIDLQKIKSLPLNFSKEINLVFVGSPGQIWHGVDRVIELAEIFKMYKFHVIGPTPPENLKNCENIVFTGEIYGAELTTYLSSMDIGISSLAMERNNLKEGSPLKTREYLAAGLPVIAGYRDTAITANSDFFLDLSASTWPINATTKLEIEKFVGRWKGKRVSKSLLNGIDSAVIEKKRVHFILSRLKEE